MMEQGQAWRQYVVAGVANIAMLSAGVNMGWTSPVLVKLMDPAQSPLPGPISADEASWIGSLFNLAALIGPFIAGFLAARIGRRWSMLSCAVPLLVGWLLIAVARNVACIYAGRMAWGVGGGMLFTVSPMYCAEIATDERRGALGSYLQVFFSIGFLVVLAIGPFMTYHGIVYVGVAIVAAFSIIFFFMPETPIYHLTKNDKESAAKSLMILRGRSRAGVESELAIMEVDVQDSLKKSALVSDVFRGTNLKAFYISCATLFFQQFSGVDAVLFYLSSIFIAAGSSLDPDIAAIIVGAVQMLASLMTIFVIDRLGRKILLLISTAGTALALGFLGIYYMLYESGSPAVERLSFLPLLSLMVFIITYSWGLGPLPFALISELFSVEVKAVAASIATAFVWLLAFLVTRYFLPLTLIVGMHTAFWIFAACCVAGFFFTLFLLPETKGKSFVEIQEILAGKHKQKDLKIHP